MIDNNGSSNGNHSVTFCEGEGNKEIEEWGLREMLREVEAMPQPVTSFDLPLHFSKLVEQAEIQQYSKGEYRMGSFMVGGTNNIMYSLLVFHPTKFLECLNLYRSEIEQKLLFLEKEDYTKIDKASLLDRVFVGILGDMHGALVSLLNMKENEWETKNFRFGLADKNPTSVLESIKSTAREIVLQGHTYVTIAQKSTAIDQYRDLSQLYHHDRKKFITLVSKLNGLTESFLREDILDHQLIEEADKSIKELNIQSATTLSEYLSEFMQPTFIEYLKENTDSGYAPLLTKFISTLSDIGSFDSSIFVPKKDLGFPSKEETVKVDARTKLISFDGLEGLIQHIRGWDPHNVEFLNAQAPDSFREFVDQYAMVVNLILKYRPDPNGLEKNIKYLENAVTEALQHIENFFKTPKTWEPDFDAPRLKNNVGERKLLSDFLRNTKIKVTKKVEGKQKDRICPISEYLEYYVGGVLKNKINKLIDIELRYAKDVDSNEIEKIRKRIFSRDKGDHSVTSRVTAF